MTSVYPGHSNERTVLLSRSAPPVEAPAGRVHRVRSTDSGVRQQGSDPALHSPAAGSPQLLHLSGSVRQSVQR